MVSSASTFRQKQAAHPAARQPLVIVENIPVELHTYPHWVVWRFGSLRADGKRGKVPVNARTGRPASVANPDSWGSFDEVIERLRHGTYHGIGFVFGADDLFP